MALAIDSQSTGSFDPELLELIFNLGSPYVEPSTSFPPVSSAVVFQEEILVGGTAPQTVATGTRIHCKLRCTSDGKLAIVAPNDALRTLHPELFAKRRKVNRSSQAVQSHDFTILDHPGYDGELCSYVSKHSIPIAAVNGPLLHVSPDRSVILEYGIALVPDATMVNTHQQTSALRFLSRALEDPTLLNPQDYTAGPLDLLRVITRTGEGQSKTPAFDVEGLNTSLLPFQRETVHWLLRREGKSLDSNGIVEDLDASIRDYVACPALGWRKAPATEIWVNPYILKTSSSDPVVPKDRSELHGDFAGKGLLAEEMGLGKTLEIISLVLLHKRPLRKLESKIETLQGGSLVDLRKVKATLVIVPKTILQQWVSEVKIHAPHLRTFVLSNPVPDIEELAQADIVFVTYSQLSRWMPHTVVGNKRQTRGASRYQFEVPDDGILTNERKVSTLIGVQFWRVVLDEVQMVHSGASAAAITAQRIPRVHAWAASGTPVKHSLEDLRGIIYFLQLHPFIERPCWQRLIASPIDFANCMQSVAIRHTKPLVAHQLHIPAQNRKLSLLKFSSVERIRYERLFREFEEDAKSSNCNLFNWLLRLRQICSHIFAQPNTYSQSWSGALNTSLGQAGLESTDVVALTLEQVLTQLVDEANSELWSEQRDRLTLLLELGLLYDKDDNLNRAIELWKLVVSEIEAHSQIVNDRTKELQETQQYQQKLVFDAETKLKNVQLLNSNDDELNQLNVSKTDLDDEAKIGDEDNNYQDLKRSLTISQHRLKSFNIRQKSLQELLHRAFFFIGTGYFRKSQRMKLKLSEEELMSDENKMILKENYDKETEYYELAEKIRTSILRESEKKVVDLYAEKFDLKLISAYKHCKVPKAKTVDSLTAFIQELVCSLQVILEQPLIEEKQEELGPGVQSENDAYSKTLDLQENAFLYLEMLQILLRDRAAAINGGNIQPRPSTNDSGNQDLAKELIEKREDIVQSLHYDRIPLITVMKSTNTLEKILSVLRSEVKACQEQYANLRNLYNARVDYYKQLQDLSDQVVDIDNSTQIEFYTRIQAKLEELRRTDDRISEKLKNQKYLRNLEGSNHSATQKRVEHDSQDQFNSHPTNCTICLEVISDGAMTPCGHLFCSECLLSWLTTRGTCPLCQRNFKPHEIHTFIPKSSSTDEIKSNVVKGDEASTKNGPSDTDETHASDLYVPISNRLYNQIHRIPIPRKYGVKIDMIVRHVKYLRSEDPTAQIVIFSQWATMLKVLRTAFSENKIVSAVTSNSSVDVNSFRTNPNVACLLLHAKADVAGLTLVNANHVFLCEPLINTALELQAVSRVNRIGQLRETLVWQFCVENTVEQNILGMTTKARLLQTVVDGNMEAADSTTLAEAAMQRTLVDRKSGAETINDNQALRRILFRQDNI